MMPAGSQPDATTVPHVQAPGIWLAMGDFSWRKAWLSWLRKRNMFGQGAGRDRRAFYRTRRRTMNIGTLLRALANGVNPDTGELLRPASAACAPEAIRLLFALADEFDGESELQKKARLTPEEKRQKNLAEGRPANAYFPWPEEEKLRLRESHAAGATLEALSDEFERSTWSIAVQLQKMGLMGEEQAAAYR